MAPELYALYEEAMALPASLSAPADDEREQGALEQDNLGGYDAYPVDEEIHGDGAAAVGGVAHAAEEANGAKGQAPAAGSARKSVRSPGIAQPLTAEGNEGGQTLAADLTHKAAGCRPGSLLESSQCNGCMQQGPPAFHILERHQACRRTVSPGDWFACRSRVSLPSCLPLNTLALDNCDCYAHSLALSVTCMCQRLQAGIQACHTVTHESLSLGLMPY